MTNDIKTRLVSWGAWTKDFGNKGGCSSPAQALINSAPFCDSDYKRRARYDNITFISDEDALEVDKAMCELRRYSARLDVALGHMLEHELDDDNLLVCVLMYDVLVRHYRLGESLRAIATDLTNCLKKTITDVKVKSILERGAGFIEGRLMA